jgi:hypothetical protein
VDAQLQDMPRIVEQDPAQKAMYMKLQQRRQELKQSLQGPTSEGLKNR